MALKNTSRPLIDRSPIRPNVPTVSYYCGISDALYFLSQLPLPKRTLAMSAILSISTMLLGTILKKTPTEKVPYSPEDIDVV